MRQTIAALVAGITPYDDLERSHIATTLDWIASGAPLCRITKPATPRQHLVSYVVVVDLTRQQVALVDHIKADLWLPTGGHVEADEHPRTTAIRELREELHLDAIFLLSQPFFLTVTETVGSTAGHIDVSLWYVVQGDSTQSFYFDSEEFCSVRWFSFAHLPILRTDPHLERYIAKLRASL